MFRGMFFGHDLLSVALVSFAAINSALVLGNFLPYYWFDGGYLLQSILWPFLDGAAALHVTCIVGMILAVPMFALALVHQERHGPDLLGVSVHEFLQRRKTMEGPEAPVAAATGWRSRRWAKSSTRALAKRRREERKIDDILAKVSAKGMHSLTWWEKRTLRSGSKKMR